MSLTNLKELLSAANQDGYAVGSFSVSSLEMIQGAIKAAEELNSPILLQIAEVRLKYSPLKLIGPAMISAAKQSKVPVGVHFDHGLTMENVRLALKTGFTSVMFDGSQYSFHENVRLTSEAVAAAQPFGAFVEGEIGRVGGNEDNSQDIVLSYTNPDEAERFAAVTGVEALAVAIGNAHGVYQKIPKLDYDILEKIHQRTNIPLVLHGGTGTGEQGFRQCIAHGIRKINVATATLAEVVHKVNDLFSYKEEVGYYDLHEAEITGAYESVKRHIEIFGSKNKA